MGAHTFTDTIADRNLTPDEAYRRLVDDATHMYGHDGYNGTISTTRGFTVVQKGKRKTDTVIREILDGKNDRYSNIEKWGPAGCIELTGVELKRAKESHGLKGRRNVRAYIFFGWAAS